MNLKARVRLRPRRSCVRKPAHTGSGRRRTTCAWGRGLEAFTGRSQKSLFFVERKAGCKAVARRGNIAGGGRFRIVCTSAGGESPAAALAFHQTPLFDVRESRPGYIGIKDGRQLWTSRRATGRNVRHRKN